MMSKQEKKELAERAEYYQGLLGKLSKMDMAALSVVIGIQIGAEHKGNLKDDAEVGIIILDETQRVVSIVAASAVSLGFKGRPISALRDNDDENQEDAA